MLVPVLVWLAVSHFSLVFWLYESMLTLLRLEFVEAGDWIGQHTPVWTILHGYWNEQT